MAVAVIMPRQGQSVESCIITKWHKKAGDKVDVGDMLFSYETDKASFDEEAKQAGTLLAILVDEGDDVPVLETVAVIGDEGEDYSAIAAGAGAGATLPETEDQETIKSKKEQKEAAAPTVTRNDTGDVKISPRARA
jgi:pyruvate dehydrogenase E2 component (dihydrolipoamide acetyltransferase)